MYKVLFVCHGNICRSPMAEFIMKKIARDRDLPIYSESAATSREEIGNDIYPPAKAELRRRGIPFERRAARQLTKSDYQRFDLIVGMDRFNIRNIMRILETDPDRKVRLLSDIAGHTGREIDDPWYTGEFGKAYEDIYEGCNAIADSLKNA